MCIHGSLLSALRPQTVEGGCGVGLRCSVFRDAGLFFFKQKTAYGIRLSLVGSEMCIRVGEVQKVAALMRFELERGNVDGFAKLLDYHWELSKKVDAGSSNTLIEQIFSSIEELIDGRLVCGAGGGGFLQVVLKKGVTKRQVAERLHEVFMDSLVDVADCKLLW